MGDKVLCKKTCDCGRKIMIPRKDKRNAEYRDDFCRHCKQYGLEESRRQFLNIMRKGENTVYS